MTDFPSTRRRFAIASAAAAVAVISGTAVKAAEFEFKGASNQSADQPSSVRVTQMWSAIERESRGRIKSQFFPSAALGGDLAMLSQLRLGALQYLFINPGVIQSIVQPADISNLAFAFKDPTEAFRVMDGPLGDYVRKEIDAKGVHPMRNIWDSGMRQITSSSRPLRVADDMAGFKIRIVESRIAVEFFRALGSIPTPLSFNETYTALQTKIVDGCDLPVGTIEAARIYEVQKYLSLTNHNWSGLWLVVNGELWKRLPPDLQEIVERNAAKYAQLERRDSLLLAASVADKLRRQGMLVNQVDAKTFRAKLGSYYASWAKTFGPTEWGLLESAVGSKLG